MFANLTYPAQDANSFIHIHLLSSLPFVHYDIWFCFCAFFNLHSLFFSIIFKWLLDDWIIFWLYNKKICLQKLSLRVEKKMYAFCNYFLCMFFARNMCACKKKYAFCNYFLYIFFARNMCSYISQPSCFSFSKVSKNSQVILENVR